MTVLSNQDTIIKYAASPTIINNIENTFYYNYSYNNLEIPIMFTYQQNKLKFYGGCYVSLITYKIGKYSYMVKEDNYNGGWFTSEKTLSGFEKSFSIYPSLQVSYSIDIKRNKIEPYIAFYYAIKNQDDLYIQIGINVPLDKNILK